MSLKEMEFAMAAKVIGCSDLRILLKHLVVNALGPIIVVGGFFIDIAYGGYGEVSPYTIAAGSALLLAGTGLEIASAVSIKKIARDYNTMSKQSDYACRLSLVAPATGGLGVRLTF